MNQPCRAGSNRVWLELQRGLQWFSEAKIGRLSLIFDRQSEQSFQSAGKHFSTLWGVYVGRRQTLDVFQVNEIWN